MRCPGCGGNLEPVTVGTLDNSLRCADCKGLWVPGWLVNNLTEGKELTIEPAGVQVRYGNGTNACPTDNVRLVLPPKEVPKGYAVQTCPECGWWWFAGDELFRYAKYIKDNKSVTETKPAGRGEWTKYAWPALVLVVMLVGVTATTVMVRRQQSAQVTATVVVGDLQVTRLGETTVEVRFGSAQFVYQAEYRRVGEAIWRQAIVVNEGNGQYMMRLSGISAGTYQVRIGEEMREFRVE